MDHYKELLQTQKAPSSIWKSLFLAVASATICSMLGTAVVVMVRKSRGFFKKALEGISLLPEMLPSIVLVIGRMLFWNAVYKIIPLYNTIWIMVLAYVAPALLGAGPAALGPAGVASISQAWWWEVEETTMSGPDVRISAVPVPR